MGSAYHWSLLPKVAYFRVSLYELKPMLREELGLARKQMKSHVLGRRMEGGGMGCPLSCHQPQKLCPLVKYGPMNVWIWPIRLAISLPSRELSSECPEEVSVARCSPLYDINWKHKAKREDFPQYWQLSGVWKRHVNQADTCSTSGLGLDLAAFRVFSCSDVKMCTLAPHWSIFPDVRREDLLLFGFCTPRTL